MIQNTTLIASGGLVHHVACTHTAVTFDLALLCNTPCTEYDQIIEDTLLALEAVGA